MVDRSRFAELLPAASVEDKHALIVGCGGIGSYTAKILARLGVQRFTLVDFDKVEAVNVGTQDFPLEAVGVPKVFALGRELEALGAEVEQVEGRFVAAHAAKANIVVASVDDIPPRREVWAAIKGRPGVAYIDPRMGAMVLDLFALWTDDVRAGKRYGAFLKNTSYSEDPCGARAIAFTGAFAGAVVGATLRELLLDPAAKGVNVVGDLRAMTLRREGLV